MKFTNYLIGIGCIALLITTPYQTSARSYWCDIQQRLCRGKEHIGCTPNSFPSSRECRGVHVMYIDRSTKELLVKMHNNFRNQIAGGQIRKYPQASNMAVMQWDDTLQQTAEMHVSHCVFAHDQCRATTQFPYSGQNLAYQATSLGWPKNTTAAIERGLQAMFDEWKLARPSIIEKLVEGLGNIYHFTLMVNDKNNHLGCGIIEYQKVESNNKLMNAFLLTCNYGYTNIAGEAVYQKGRFCSKCSSGCSSEYRALCARATSGSSVGGNIYPGNNQNNNPNNPPYSVANIIGLQSPVLSVLAILPCIFE